MGLNIKVRLFGGLTPPKSYPKNESNEYLFQVEENYRVANLIEELSLSDKPLIVVINGLICNDYERAIKEGDVISFFPPIAGG